MTELSDLIARVEAASGPDRELDLAIALAMGWKRGHVVDPQGWRDWVSPTAQYQVALPKWTADIREALTLLPEGWIWQVSNRAPKPNAGRAYIHNDELIYAGIGFRKNPKFESAEVVAATPALALCAAILKARQASNGDRHAGEKGE